MVAEGNSGALLVNRRLFTSKRSEPSDGNKKNSIPPVHNGIWEPQFLSLG
jgi:hypothetical protein